MEKLSQDLRIKYPEMNGLSDRNLWDCKRFYLTYRDYSKLRTLFAEISWSHNLLLLNKTSSIKEKEFYLKMSLKERWSFRELQRQIVDFIVKLKDGRIALFDTKSALTLKVAGPKIEGLHRYIKNENKKGKKVFGGIVTNTNPKNYSGRWIYFDRPSKDFKGSDFDNWEDLEL